MSGPARLAALEAALETLADFHSQPSLQPLEAQLAQRRSALHWYLLLLHLLRRSRIGIALVLIIVLLSMRRRWFGKGRQTIYAVGLTPNNMRSLKNVAAPLVAAGTPFEVNQASFPFLRRVRLISICGTVAALLKARGDQRDFVFLHQVIAVVYVLLFEDDLKFTTPRLVVVANDHSPPAVALLAIAQALGLQTCYVQHGPVTASFPPLTSTFAVLFSTQAKEAYAQAAKRRGYSSQTEVLLYPALTEPPSKIRAPQPPLQVCIALSFFVDLERLALRIDQLKTHSEVHSILISQHPRSTQNLQHLNTENLRVLPRRTPTCEIAKVVDLCLVGNSGVAIEFLHHGCPTFYTGVNDEALDDYYGFVKDGLLPRFSPSVLDDRVESCAFFDHQWQTNMAKVDPLFEADIDDFAKTMIARFQLAIKPVQDAVSE